METKAASCPMRSDRSKSCSIGTNMVSHSLLLGFCLELFSLDRPLIILHSSISFCYSISLTWLEVIILRNWWTLHYMCACLFVQCFSSLLEYKLHEGRNSALSIQVDSITRLTLGTSNSLTEFPYCIESLILPKSFLYLMTLLPPLWIF